MDKDPENTPHKGRGRFGVSRAQWVAAALDRLEQRGVEAVRVQAVAAAVGVTKSGFYWHFRDREELMQSLLSHWGDLEEQPLVDLGDTPAQSPEATLRAMADTVDRQDLSRFDAAIRQWARSDDRVAEVYRAKMDRRLDFVRSLFRDLGFTGIDLEMRARTYVAFVTAERAVFPDQTPEERAEIRAAQLDMLLSRRA